jgi:hypothetical protein
MIKKRKSPVRHRVKSHTREGHKVRAFMRGSGQKTQLKRKMKLNKVEKGKIQCPSCGFKYFPTGDDQFRLSKGYSITCPNCKQDFTKKNLFNFQKQLQEGIKIEMEHTDNPKIAEQIARDHLREFPDYYTRLKKMESEAKKELSNPKNYIQQTKGYRLQNDKLQLYVATGKTTNDISTRNRKILTILKAEEATSSKELARRLGLREQTILVELKYLEKEGFVKEID